MKSAKWAGVVAAVALLGGIGYWMFAQMSGRPSASRVAESSAVISWEEAGGFIGQTRTVEGTIELVFRVGQNLTVLKFNPGGGDPDVSAVISSDVYDLFPAGFDKLYQCKKVRVTGEIKTYRDQPQIVVRSPSQIQILADAAAQYVPGSENLIPYKDAGRYVGQIKTVEGVVRGVNNDNFSTHFEFEPDSRSAFYVVIFNTAYDEFPGGFEKYRDKKVQVAGKIRTHRSQPKIIVLHASEIRIAP